MNIILSTPIFLHWNNCLIANVAITNLPDDIILWCSPYVLSSLHFSVAQHAVKVSCPSIIQTINTELDTLLKNSMRWMLYKGYRFCPQKNMCCGVSWILLDASVTSEWYKMEYGFSGCTFFLKWGMMDALCLWGQTFYQTSF